jgi:beta-glucosidase
MDQRTNRMTTPASFPPGFLWGAATASYQIEGAPHEDGKGESIWDRFSHTPGKVSNGDTGDLACDHYHRWPQDVELMREMGLGAYRFSVAWPRILPEGRGAVNRAGLDFYDRLTDALLEKGIVPFVTLYHWDLPQALQDAGGWNNRDTARLFADYAEIVATRLGDRVKRWITHNEPIVAAFNGHYTGEHAPGIKDLGVAYQVAHHLLLSHGLATQVLKSQNQGFQTGITLNLTVAHPAGDSSDDEAAARRQDGYSNRWFLDPVFRGSYPEDMLEIIGSHAPSVQDGDMATITSPLDFLGINYYSRSVVRHDPGNPPFNMSQVKPRGAEYTDANWEVYPDGLRELLERLHRDYPAPAYYVTENGAAFPDLLSPGDKVHDPRRQAYLEAHFEAAASAISAGVPLKGYFVWSLMDNFEWALGYSKRFGIIYVDYPTQRRIWKDSALWYRECIGG